MIPLDAVGTAGVKQRGGSHYIGAHKGLRIRNRTVYVALSRKVYHHIRFFLLKQVENERPICDIALYKSVIWPVLNGL